MIETKNIELQIFYLKNSKSIYGKAMKKRLFLFAIFFGLMVLFIWITKLIWSDISLILFVVPLLTTFFVAVYPVYKIRRLTNEINELELLQNDVKSLTI